MKEKEWLTTKMWSYLARGYLDLQHLRIAWEARIRKLRAEKDVPNEVMAIIEDYYGALKSEEKNLLERISERLKEHPAVAVVRRRQGDGASRMPDVFRLHRPVQG